MKEYFQAQIDFYNSETPAKPDPLLFCLLYTDDSLTSLELKSIKLSELNEALFVGFEFSEYTDTGTQLLPVFKPI